ncbi:hypothetical protein, partial [Paenibacillus sp. N3.4]|uniref:hypothetical protein n=1 Tax=Paenibacillus sp. N3.4 TaxID=2603222 RepID=UPI001C9D3544
TSLQRREKRKCDGISAVKLFFRVTEGKWPVSDAVSTKNELTAKEEEKTGGMLNCKSENNRAYR